MPTTGGHGMHGRKRKGAAVVGLLAIVSLAIAATALARVDAPAATAAPNVGCDNPTIGFQGPITGDAAFIGKEQLGFAQYAIKKLGGGTIKLSQQDTQLDPAQASTTGTKLHANADVLAVVGPAGSQEVLAVAPIYKKAQDVFIVDDQTAYSRPLANGVQANLKAAGIKVTRNSVNQKVTDFSALVSKIGDGVDIVYLPWQIAANAQIFGQQMKEQGKSAVIVGSDGLDSGDFKIQGSYVVAFAPDIRGIPGNAAFIRGYGKKFVSNFGPPTYVATQAAIAAIKKACADGNATRSEVQAALRTTFIPKTVLGGNLQFTARGDVKGAKFYVFKLGSGGKKTLVG